MEKVICAVSSLVLMAIALVGTANLQGAPANERDLGVQKEIMALEDQLRQWGGGSVDILDRIYADDMAWTARGKLLTKAQVLDEFRSGRLRNNSPKHDDIHIHVYGNTVVLTGHSTSQLVYEGKTLASSREFSDVFVKLNGRWQLVAHTVTDAAK